MVESHVTGTVCPNSVNWSKTQWLSRRKSSVSTYCEYNLVYSRHRGNMAQHTTRYQASSNLHPDSHAKHRPTIQLCTFANKPGMISISFSPYSYFWPSILGAFVRRCCCAWRAFTHCSMVKCWPSLVRSLSFKPRRLRRGLLEMGSRTTWLLGLWWCQ